MSAVSTGASPEGRPFDGRVVELQAEPPPATHRRGWRQLLEWSGPSAPVAALLLAGIALGPSGMSLLSTDTLSLLAPALPVAVGALGVVLEKPGVHRLGAGAAPRAADIERAVRVVKAASAVGVALAVAGFVAGAMVLGLAR